MTLFGGLVNGTQVAIDPLKVHYAHGILCGLFTCGTTFCLNCCSYVGVRGRGVAGGGGGR